ncbi:MAG: hypothetical protein KF708_19555 [Pirellulales bacterium]|nr:hypothetical protein [Pirellulales bacterium]
MPIEFRCTNCEKLLRVPDETAGRQAKCPACDTVLAIPHASTSGPSLAPPQPASGEANPYQAPSLTNTQADRRTSAAGPFPTAPKIDPLAVIGRAWEIFKLKMSFVILVVVIGFGLQYLVSFAIAFGNIMLRAAMPGMGVYLASEIVYNLVVNVFNSWLWFGVILALLRMTRGEPTSVGDIFRGGRFLLRAIIATILLWLVSLLIVAPFVAPGGILMMVRGTNDTVATLVLGGGFLLAMIPLLYVSISILQYPFLIVDRDLDAIAAITLSWKLTAGNRWRLLALYFIAGLLAMGGVVVCCVPALITIPLAVLTSVVAYLTLTGQSSIESFARETAPPTA